MPYTQIILLIVTFIAIANAPNSGNLHFSKVFVISVWMLKLFGWIIVCFYGALFARQFRTALIDAIQWLTPIPLVIDIYILQIHRYFINVLPGNLNDIFISFSFLFLYFVYLIIYWFIYWLALPLRPLTSELLSRVITILPACVPFILFTTVDEVIQYLLSKNLELPFDKVYIFYFVYLVMIVILIILIPYFIKIMWQCESFPPGEFRSFIENTCRSLGVKFKDILLWNNPWGSVCTAGVMGFLPGFRYLLLTPCIVENLSAKELQAVIYHEIAHIKNHHLFWQALIILSFSVMVSTIAKPLFFYLVSTKVGFEVYLKITKAPDYIANFLMIVPIIIVFLLYLRFFIGYFIRSFERDADVTALQYQGHPWYLITALEKVGYLSGISKHSPNWHHYSIAQRIDFLRSCFINPELIKKFKSSLIFKRNSVLAVSLIITAIGLLIPFEPIKDRLDSRILNHFVGDLNLHNENPEMLLLLSQFFMEKNLHEKAYEALIIAKEKAPDHPDVLNNLAWFILTNEEKKYFDPKLALELAQRAYSLKKASYIMDTLAEAYYANGDFEKAVYYGELALKHADENIEHYQKQLKKFYEALNSKNQKS